ncbi:Periplasmic [NiFeSe] hydrogenase small subunit precursor [Sporomusa ovata DSM 2662]|uniref:[Ni/Fe] hydrogenase, group 1, small subunit n=1 Tax=Sporomusa ovata TaxID=2378 RepID=A0A0U1L3V3_9FIRM|nr:hydrogenase small subunit [Sporomusa ovata]CQR74381.1 [Ni/Fe] hydrogenase, group 1, small subunit [Sporomusa ovata]
MEKKDFEAICHQKVCSPDHSLSASIIPAASEHIRRHNKVKLPVIWLETSDSGDNNIAFMNTTYPYLHQVFTDMINLLFSNTFMAAQGADALALLFGSAKKYKGSFTLVVEGAIPTQNDGIYNVVARTKKRAITALEAVTTLGGMAEYVVAIGTCASFGGASSAAPNLTGSVGVSKVLNREVINVSGCPVNPDWFVGTLAHLLMYGKPELDSLGRPTLFYGATVHRHCQRRSYFDNKDYAEKLGDIECMFSLGCAGPKTSADCPYRQWTNHVSWPVKVNTPCIGCTNQDFPDGSTPFFVPLPQKDKSTQTGAIADSAAKGDTYEPKKNPV